MVLSASDKHVEKQVYTEPRQGSLFVEWGRCIAVAVFLSLLVRWPILEPYKIPSGSMEPTFVPGDRIFVDKHVYGLRYPFNGLRIPFTLTTLWYSDGPIIDGKDVERWDIVVFKAIEKNVKHDTLVKRVVGLPGEKVLIRDGQLLIDGEVMPIPDFMPPVEYTQAYNSNGYGLIDDDAHSVIPEGHYFMLGDNSSYSRDGRWFGFVPKNHLLGRVTSIWFPKSNWRDFTGYTGSIYWRGFWVIFGLYLIWRTMFGRSWKLRRTLMGGLLNKRDHVFIRFSMGFPFPFLGFRLTSGRELQRGDIVMFRSKNYKGRDEGLIGVVAGLPGERVHIQDGALRINEKAVEGPWDSQSYPLEDKEKDKFGRSKSKDTSHVPEGHVYILTNDGCANEDSRVLGWVSRGEIIGTVSGVWWKKKAAKPVGEVN